MRVDPDLYASMQDYYRDPDLRVSVDALNRMQELQIKAGFQRTPVDFACRTDLSCKDK